MDVLERDMSATPAEFAHGLRLAFGNRVEGGPLEYRVRIEGTLLEVRLTPLPDRVIAGLRLPRLQARLCFVGGDAASRASLLARMDLAMHRGGG